MKRSRLSDSLARHYDPRIQITPAQIEAIAGAIATRQPECNLLVFGTGHDSRLWADLNAGGRTLFVEDSPEWAARAQAAGLEVAHHFYDTTVAGSLASPDEVVAMAAVPEFLARTGWDVILIDGPRGWQPHHPGRALPIIWSARLRTPATHVFLHDWERQLEAMFGRRLLAPQANWTVIPGQGRDRQLFWSIGRSSAFAPSASPPRSGRG